MKPRCLLMTYTRKHPPQCWIFHALSVAPLQFYVVKMYVFFFKICFLIQIFLIQFSKTTPYVGSGAHPECMLAIIQRIHTHTHTHEKTHMIIRLL